MACQWLNGDLKSSGWLDLRAHEHSATPLYAQSFTQSCFSFSLPPERSPMSHLYWDTLGSPSGLWSQGAH